jgi:hypothetical protein
MKGEAADDEVTHRRRTAPRHHPLTSNMSDNVQDLPITESEEPESARSEREFINKFYDFFEPEYQIRRLASVRRFVGSTMSSQRVGS